MAPWQRLFRLRCVPGLLGLLACALWAGVPTTANAQGEVILYRCTDASGTVVLQNDRPCPKGSTQEKRRVAPAPSAPPSSVSTPPVIAPAAATEPVENAPASGSEIGEAPAFETVKPLPASDTPLGERLPPPPLYQCNTPDNDSYLSDTPDPKPRCVRMDTVGIDGSQQLGAGQACSMVYDQCQRVPDGAACDAWRKRVNEAQSAWTFGRADAGAALKAEYERIARVVAETTCNQ